MRSALVAVVLLGATLARGSTVTLTVEEMPAGALARVIARRGDLDLIVDPAVEGHRVSVHLVDAVALDALHTIASLVGGILVPRAGGTLWLGPPPVPEMTPVQAKLAAVRVDIRFDGRDLAGCLAGIADSADVPLQLVPEAIEGLRLDGSRAFGLVSNVRADHALEIVTARLGLGWVVRWGIVVVTTPDRLEAPADDPVPPSGSPNPREAAWRRVLAEQTLDLDFVDVPLSTVFDFLREAREIPFLWDSDARTWARRRTVSFRGSGRVGDLLARLLDDHALRITVVRGRPVIGRRP